MVGTGTGIGSSVTNPSMQVGGTFLDDIQVNFLLQATQANETTRTLTAPHITLFNGQRAYVTVGTEQAYLSQFIPVISDNATSIQPVVSWVPTGSVLDVEATVTADRRFVTMTIRPQISTLNSMKDLSVGGYTLQLPNVTVQKLETTVNVPDGGTLLLGGQKMATQVEREQGVPLLSKIPIINRAFNNRGMTRDEQTLLILVKPKILIMEEEMQKVFPD
jgi:type II secretory pathway component GspD/PulD (secretin)